MVDSRVNFRFNSFVAAKWLIAKVGFMAGLALSLAMISQATMAQSNENLLETLRLSSQQAEMLGLERKVFDFKSQKLNFETIVPKGAELILNAYEDQIVEDGQIGRVLPLGKALFIYEDVAIEDTIYSYKLRYAPAALRTCQWQMQEDGYFIFHSIAKNKLTEAELFGMQFDGENKTATKAEFGYCYARGDVLIAHFFSASFAGISPVQQKQTIQILRKTVSYMASNMVMADDKPNSIDDNLMQNLAIDLDGDTLVLTYPKGLDVVVNNSDRKILPYEFHLVQKLQTGEMFSHLFLWINKASEPASEESFRRQADIFAEIYVSSQLNTTIDGSKDTKEGDVSNNDSKPQDVSSIDKSTQNVNYEFIGRNSIPGFAQVGIMARSYQYKIIDKNSPDNPTMFFVSVIGYKDKTYVLYYHSLRGGVSKASEYFTGLAGDIAYDSIRQSLYNFLVGLK